MEHYKIDITQEQRDNLKKLADYLLSGNLRAEFDMNKFSETNVVRDFSIHCGSVGCAVGHGPNAGIPKTDSEDWVYYADRVFGACSDVFTDDPLFDWCFSSEWKDTDNTPQGAAKRILYMLENGVPNDYLDQSYGGSALCY